MTINKFLLTLTAVTTLATIVFNPTATASPLIQNFIYDVDRVCLECDREQSQTSEFPEQVNGKRRSIFNDSQDYERRGSNYEFLRNTEQNGSNYDAFLRDRSQVVYVGTPLTDLDPKTGGVKK